MELDEIFDVMCSHSAPGVHGLTVFARMTMSSYLPDDDGRQYSRWLMGGGVGRGVPLRSGPVDAGGRECLTCVSHPQPEAVVSASDVE